MEKIIDSHAHLNFSAFEKDREEVIKNCLNNNIWVINVGSQYQTSKKAVAIANSYEKGIYASVGLHPIHAQDGFDYEKYKKLALDTKTVAIGEIGLDYKKEYVSFKKEQENVFLNQLDLAKELNLPIIFHCRMAHDHLIEILENYYDKGQIRGVMHCFTGNLGQAEKYLSLGLFLGFNGIIFKMDLEKIIKKIPIEKILLETDCPYLTPPNKIGRNEPVYTKYVVQEIARIKKISYEEVSSNTVKNTKDLFNL